MERRFELSSQVSQKGQPLRDLFEQVKNELEEARQDLDAARVQTEEQRLWIQRERDLVAKLVNELSVKRQGLTTILEAVKRDKQASETLRKRMEETAEEAGKMVDAILEESQLVWEGLAEERKELAATSERIQDVQKRLSTRRSQLRGLASQMRETRTAMRPSWQIQQCPTCGREIGPRDLYCDTCGTTITRPE